MNWRTFLISIVLFDFVVLTIYAVAEVGYINLITSHFTNWGGIQVITDLVIACSLAIIWMIADARRRGTNPWPYVVATVFLGSIGPLLYLLVQQWSRHSAHQVQAQQV